MPSAEISERTRNSLATLRAKKMPESSTPTRTPCARSWVATVTATVASMTMLELFGCTRRSASDLHEKVPIETMTITATSAAIGMVRTTSPSTRMRKSRKQPAKSVDRRPRPPDFTLMTDWPIMAQPAMPPNRPATMFAAPCPRHSRFLSEGVSVSSSTMAAVISDSSSPTTARVAETGRIVRSVSKVGGTRGSRKAGKSEGSSPMWPTVRTSRPRAKDTAVSTTMATNGDGTAVVSLGSK